jgi:hypothetical protein
MTSEQDEHNSYGLDSTQKFKDKRAFGANARTRWPRQWNKRRPLDLAIDGAAVSSHVVYIPAPALALSHAPPFLSSVGGG